MALTWFIKQFNCFQHYVFIKGWIFDDVHEIHEIGFSLDGEYLPLQAAKLRQLSPHVSHVYGAQAEKSSFNGYIYLVHPEKFFNLILTVTLSNKKIISLKDFQNNSSLLDNTVAQLQHRFFQQIQNLPKQAHIIEIGSRARSGITRKQMIPKQVKYTGFDILQGDNVDVIGDAHQLGHYFEPDSCDVIFSMSVFEHLIMPWKVALEINKVLKVGGTVMITTHQTWALHEMPWDFWRFSDQAWRALFNQFTGFEIIDMALAEPASIVAHQAHPAVFGLENYPAYLATAVIAKKLTHTDLSWDVDANVITQSMYPQ